jgi:hypothetical protein
MCVFGRCSVRISATWLTEVVVCVPQYVCMYV